MTKVCPSSAGHRPDGPYHLRGWTSLLLRGRAGATGRSGTSVIRLILATTGTSTLDGIFDTGDVVFQVRKIMLTDT